MNSSSIDLKDMLEAESSLNLICDTSTISDRNLFIGKEPVKPSNCVTIFDTYGTYPDLNFSNQGYEYPSVQIRVRNTDYRNGWDLAQNIVTSLHARSNETWNGAIYTVIYCSGGPALLDWDDNGNARFVISINLQRHAV